MSRLVTHAVLHEFLQRTADTFDGDGTIYLVGETSQVYESWRGWTSQIDVSAEIPDRAAFNSACRATANSMGVLVLDEFPGDLIPLPDGYDLRSRPAGRCGGLVVRHFDPYSTAFRYIARGDEPDYHLVLTYLKHKWIEIDEMNQLLDRLLPRFSVTTIQQDPAEFRRKYKGLLQMAQSVEPGTVHRHTIH